ncbi:hypothetical protein BABINDRAFT_163986 [Babjeviella inositovora NRRL Y-12698]|uniref:Uncharacterized protein n=1 Tax=Babjeviella inositovora NRRL Y-12698 TaxID=984486 RepID=A0A1E3QXB1_9ASCO|nr:uncharacterized protein BABINDRAFT_163986 [Babjeviella inositovora NRRL Y-12698]ODQ82174.1 hypothetical protein BABINDRAFT_163986 [Babjeviella inositovora NRRL Y-12698]
MFKSIDSARSRWSRHKTKDNSGSSPNGSSPGTVLPVYQARTINSAFFGDSGTVSEGTEDTEETVPVTYWNLVHEEFTASEISIIKHCWYHGAVENGSTSPSSESSASTLYQPEVSSNGPSPISQRSFKECLSSDQFWETVYLRLGETEPELVTHLPRYTHQTTAINLIVNLTISNLENLPKVQDYLVKLGRAHDRLYIPDPIHLGFKRKQQLPLGTDRKSTILIMSRKLGTVIFACLDEYCLLKSISIPSALYDSEKPKGQLAEDFFRCKRQTQYQELFDVYNRIWRFICRSMVVGLDSNGVIQLADNEMRLRSSFAS